MKIKYGLNPNKISVNHNTKIVLVDKHFYETQTELGKKFIKIWPKFMLAHVHKERIADSLTIAKLSKSYPVKEVVKTYLSLFSHL